MLNVNTAIHHTEKEVAVVVFFDDTAEAGRVDEIGEMVRNRPVLFIPHPRMHGTSLRILILRIKIFWKEYLKMTIRWSIPIIIRCI